MVKERKYKKYLVNVDVVVIAKNEDDAKDRIDTQLGYSGYGGMFESPEVERYDDKTKIKKIKEMKK
jgi:hypothetical protein